MAGAYCSPDDVREMTNAEETIDLTNDQAYHFIRIAMTEIDACCAGIYSVPFISWSEPLLWNASDDVPPFIRSWCEKLASSYVMRELYIARAGKNQSPYGDKLFWESTEICRKMKNGEINLLDKSGDPLTRLTLDDTDNLATTFSRSSTPDGDDDWVMPDMHEPYPNDTDGGDIE